MKDGRRRAFTGGLLAVLAMLAGGCASCAPAAGGPPAGRVQALPPAGAEAGSGTARGLPGAGLPLSDPATGAIGLTRDDTIFTRSARTVDFNGQAIIPRFTYFQATGAYDGNSRKSDPLDRELRVYATTLQGVFGLHEDVTLALNLPFVVKELKTTMGGDRVRLDSEGPGDVAAVAKWRFFKDPVPGGTTEIAGFLGLELPTGRDDVRDGGQRLPRPLQPGSGSLDGILGTAFTHVWDGGRWLINADLFYKANSEGDDYRFGDVLSFDVGGQYRLYPYRYERYDQLTVNVILELNGSWAQKDTLDGDRIGTTGGLKLFLSPGLQAIVTEDLLFEVGVQIPVHRDLNGPQLGEDFRGTLGLRWRF